MLTDVRNSPACVRVAPVVAAASLTPLTPADVIANNHTDLHIQSHFAARDITQAMSVLDAPCACATSGSAPSAPLYR